MGVNVCKADKPDWTKPHILHHTLTGACVYMEGGDRYAYRTMHSSVPDQKIMPGEMIVVPYLTGDKFIFARQVFVFFPPSCSLFFFPPADPKTFVS